MFRSHFISRYHFWREITLVSLSMEALMNAAVPSPAIVRNRELAKLRNRQLRTFTVRCSLSERNEELNRLIGTSSSSSSSHIKLNREEQDMREERFESPNSVPGKKSPDIWELFEEAQQNILYLNKQRIRAIEELNKANQEKQLLVDEIKQLEEKKQIIVKKDNMSFCWELLLRIDSMVVGSKVDGEEASDLRKLMMSCRTSIADIFPEILEKGDAELLADLRIFADGSRKNNVHIIHICTEMEPLVSVGSLASYITGLSRALQRKGHMVEVILPKYTILGLEELQGLRLMEAESYSYFNGQLHRNRIWTGVAYGIGVTLIDPIDYSSFFNRDRIYGYSDDFERFSYFSRASLDYLIKSKKKPDVIHIHNWETSIVGPVFWDIFAKQGLESTKILLTCHDLKSQYLEQPDKLALCGLDPTQLHRPDRLQDNTKSSFVNLLKGGVVYSNKVIIVSSLHSKGRIIREFNHGLEHTLTIHKDKLVIAPIVFDKSTWDPFKDKFLPKNYNAENLESKAECKADLQHLGELPANDSSIVVSCILHEELDIDLKALKMIVLATAGRDVQFIFMRISKQNNHDRGFESLEEIKDENVRFLDGYDESALHLVFAGSDIILCSFHDTLLQVPLKALKYGAAPIAFAPDEDHRFRRQFADCDLEETSRYSQFIASSAFGNMSLNQAIDQMKSDPYKWKQGIKNAMEMDFSWDAECSDVHISAYTTLKNL